MSRPIPPDLAAVLAHDPTESALSDHGYRYTRYGAPSNGLLEDALGFLLIDHPDGLILLPYTQVILDGGYEHLDAHHGHFVDMHTDSLDWQILHGVYADLIENVRALEHWIFRPAQSSQRSVNLHPNPPTPPPLRSEEASMPDTDWRVASLKQIRGLVAERNQLARENAQLHAAVDCARVVYETMNTFFLGDCDKPTVIRAQSRFAEALATIPPAPPTPSQGGAS